MPSCSSKKVKILRRYHISLRVSIDHAKVEEMLKWEHPKNIIEIRSIMGLVGYHRRF